MWLNFFFFLTLPSWKTQDVSFNSFSICLLWVFVVFNLERGVFNGHKLWFSAKLCQLALFTSLLAA